MFCAGCFWALIFTYEYQVCFGAEQIHQTVNNLSAKMRCNLHACAGEPRAGVCDPGAISLPLHRGSNLS